MPSTTESVFGLGAGNRLVGCTRYCIEPADRLSGVSRVGGTKNPDRERIAALRPDLVLVNAEENRSEDIAWLGERFDLLQQTPRTVAEAVVELRELARALDATAVAEPLLRRIEAELAAARRQVEQPVSVFYAIWRKPWMSINRDTFIHDVLAAVGADNICSTATTRYPEVELSTIRERRPAVVLLPSEPWEFDAEQRDELWAGGEFGDARLVLCDGRDFCWHGVRMAGGIGRAAEIIAAAVRGSDRA